jgi:hypothetical protein
MCRHPVSSNGARIPRRGRSERSVRRFDPRRAAVVTIDMRGVASSPWRIRQGFAWASAHEALAVP